MKYSIYNNQGEVLNTVDCTLEQLEHQLISGELFAIEGEYLDYQIIEGKPNPLSSPPSEYHKYDYINKQWTVDSNLVAENIRLKRNMLLSTEIDNINPIRWNSMNSEQKDDWTMYREKLLNIPQQEGFPLNVVWPEKPTL